MMCPYREGDGSCTWWITGCLNPCVPTEIKRNCSGETPRYQKKDLEAKHDSGASPNPRYGIRGMSKGANH
jgi:hypothetical protein